MKEKKHRHNKEATKYFTLACLCSTFIPLSKAEQDVTNVVNNDFIKLTCHGWISRARRLDSEIKHTIWKNNHFTFIKPQRLKHCETVTVCFSLTFVWEQKHLQFQCTPNMHSLDPIEWAQNFGSCIWNLFFCLHFLKKKNYYPFSCCCSTFYSLKQAGIQYCIPKRKLKSVYIKFCSCSYEF